jgi:hypothetical protein
MKESVSEPSNRERKVPPNSLKGEYQKIYKLCFLLLTSRSDTIRAKEARMTNITEHHKYMQLGYNDFNNLVLPGH